MDLKALTDEKSNNESSAASPQQLSTPASPQFATAQLSTPASPQFATTPLSPLQETAKSTKSSPSKKRIVAEKSKQSHNESLDALPQELQTLAKMHNDLNLSKSQGVLDGSAARRKKQTSQTHVRTSSQLSAASGQDDDESVDSEAGLIYVPGVKMNDEEARDLVKQLTDKKKRIESK